MILIIRNKKEKCNLKKILIIILIALIVLGIGFATYKLRKNYSPNKESSIQEKDKNYDNIDTKLLGYWHWSDEGITGRVLINGILLKEDMTFSRRKVQDVPVLYERGVYQVQDETIKLIYENETIEYMKIIYEEDKIIGLEVTGKDKRFDRDLEEGKSLIWVKGFVNWYDDSNIELIWQNISFKSELPNPNTNYKRKSFCSS